MDEEENLRFIPHEFFRNVLPGYAFLLLIMPFLAFHFHVDIIELFKSNAAFAAIAFLSGYPIGTIFYTFFDSIYTQVYMNKRAYVNKIKNLNNNLRYKCEAEIRAIWDSWLWKQENNYQRERIYTFSTSLLNRGSILIATLLTAFLAIIFMPVSSYWWYLLLCGAIAASNWGMFNYYKQSLDEYETKQIDLYEKEIKRIISNKTSRRKGRRRK